MWIAPFQFGLFCYLIYNEFGWSAFLGVVCIVFVIFSQFFAAKLFAHYRYMYTKIQNYPVKYNCAYRFKTALITDKRVRIMNEVIVGVRVIKMYAWEYTFKRVIKALRRWGTYTQCLNQVYNNEPHTRYVASILHDV